ncbi:hypothetical protein [Clostridium estertheticum]|nr:hypothetical protein [Clostridium estertheticum]
MTETLESVKEADFNKIFELDKRCYEKKYLISAEDTKKSLIR